MAVLKAKAEKVLPFIFPVLRAQSITPLLVTRVADGTFVGAKGDTVTFRIGGLRTRARKYEWRTRTAPIVTDDIKGGEGLDIKMDTHTYSATDLTDEHYTMDEVELGTEVTIPQAEAVVQDLEDDVTDAFYNLRPKVTLSFGPTDDPYEFALDAQNELDGFRVAPNDGRRFWLVGSNVATAILKSDRVTTTTLNGEAGTVAAVRRAEIADLAGLRVVRSLEVPADFSMVIHQTGLVLANVAPKIPPTTAVTGARLAREGWAFRQIFDYDSAYLQARSVISTFTGITPVYDERIGGTGADRYDLKPLAEGELPRSVRVVGVNYTG